MSQLPNILSWFRIVVTPVYLILILSKNPDLICLSLPVYTLGAVTDHLDGWLARKLKAVSKFGKFFDPLADKFLTDSAFVSFAMLDIIPLWMVLIIVFRDIMTTLLRFVPFFGNRTIETSYIAKLKTFFQMLFIFVVITLIFLINCGSDSVNIELTKDILYSDYIYYSMLLIVIFTMWTLVDYSKSLTKRSSR